MLAGTVAVLAVAEVVAGAVEPVELVDFELTASCCPLTGSSMVGVARRSLFFFANLNKYNIILFI